MLCKRFGTRLDDRSNKAKRIIDIEVIKCKKNIMILKKGIERQKKNISSDVKRRIRLLEEC